MNLEVLRIFEVFFTYRALMAGSLSMLFILVSYQVISHFKTFPTLRADVAAGHVLRVIYLVGLSEMASEISHINFFLVVVSFVTEFAHS